MQGFRGMNFYLLNIITWLESHQLPCMFKSVTHFDCPGCGLQRSVVYLMKGDFTGSFFMYPALLPILILFAFLIFHVTMKFKNGATILKYGYLFCASVIMVSYIYKIVFAKTF